MKQESKKISIRMDEELLRKVDTESKKEGIERSEYIRQAVKEKLEQSDSILHIRELCRLSTMYNRMIEKYELSESEKNELKKELDLLWRK